MVAGVWALYKKKSFFPATESDMQNPVCITSLIYKYKITLILLVSAFVLGPQKSLRFLVTARVAVDLRVGKMKIFYYYYFT